MKFEFDKSNHWYEGAPKVEPHIVEFNTLEEFIEFIKDETEKYKGWGKRVIIDLENEYGDTNFPKLIIYNDYVE